jgi:hypothetical protein
VAPADHPDAPPKLRYLGKFTAEEMKLGSGDMASKLRPILDDDDEPAPDSAAPPWGEK